ncbi:CapA family protein [Brevibacillus sp. H7]|uniref:CapA family protein n=1 Tax=Brevibacillus sp. H7 TaxID=3349138 RepID=UPI00381AF641
MKKSWKWNLSVAVFLAVAPLWQGSSAFAVPSDNPAPQTGMPISPPITIAITGDILLDKSVGRQIDRYGVDYPFQKTAELLRKADLTVGNLETSVSTRGKPEQKEYAYRSKPQTLQGLVNAGFDVVNLANNHTLDYGVEALFDTMEHLQKNKIGFTGAGRNEAEAFSPFLKTIKGKKVAVIGLSHVLPNARWFARKNSPGLAHAYSEEPMMSYVKKAVQQSDYTVAVLHWNLEYKDVPEPYARKLAKQLIDNGVDAVVGSHSHSLMGIEYYKQAPIFYSVGNFVFTTSRNPKGWESMIVQLTFDQKGTSSSVIPAKLINGQPVPLSGADKSRIIQKLNRLSYNAKVDEDGRVTVKSD